MHPVLREAGERLRLAVNSYGDPARIPALVDFSSRRNEHRGEIEFSVQFSDGRFTRWRVPILAIMDAPPFVRSTAGLGCELVAMWARLRIERIRELREIERAPVYRGVPIREVPDIGEELARQMLAPSAFVEWYDPGRSPRRQREITTSNVAPIERPEPPEPAGLTLNALQRMVTQLRQTMRRREPEPEPRGPCDCPMCRPDRHRAAIAKSIALLREWLPPAQLAQYDKDHGFDVTGSAGGQYRIHYGTVGNVNQYGDESRRNIIAQLCFQPEGVVAHLVGDTMLAQKIALENDEPAARAVANISTWPSPIPAELAPRPLRAPTDFTHLFGGPGSVV